MGGSAAATTPPSSSSSSSSAGALAEKLASPSAFASSETFEKENAALLLLDDDVPPVPMSEVSEILHGRMVASLVRAMPAPLLKERSWTCVYSLVRDGACAATLLDACGHHATYVLAVEDSWGYVFGACFSHALSAVHGNAYYGTGETWLFSFHNLAPEQLVT